ncbi:MAG: HigA family addiction module antitoxin [Pseudomonadota bacterium]
MTLKSATTTDRIAPVHPGEVLADEFLRPLSLSANALAARIGVPGNRVSMIVAGKRAISGDTALRLAAAFGTTAEFWMNLQKGYELEVAREGFEAVIERVG